MEPNLGMPPEAVPYLPETMYIDPVSMMAYIITVKKWTDANRANEIFAQADEPDDLTEFWSDFDDRKQQIRNGSNELLN